MKLSRKPMTRRYKKTWTQPEITLSVLLGLVPVIHSEKFEILHLLGRYFFKESLVTFDSKHQMNQGRIAFPRESMIQGRPGRHGTRNFRKIEVGQYERSPTRSGKIAQKQNKVWEVFESREIWSVLSVGYKTFLSENNEEIFPKMPDQNFASSI